METTPAAKRSQASAGTSDDSGEHQKAGAAERCDSLDASSVSTAKTKNENISGEDYQHRQQQQELIKKENKAVQNLRTAVLLLLVATAALVCVGVFMYTKKHEKDQFETDFEQHALRIIESFHDSVERRLGAVNSLATSITSYALSTNQSFPFVTIPSFAMRGSDSRIQADAMVMHYLPVITDEKRPEWEIYAEKNRFHVDEAFVDDTKFRKAQDVDFGYDKEEEGGGRQQQGGGGQQKPRPEPPMGRVNETILGDGRGYHPHIWSVGSFSPKGDEAEGTGPFLPMWQRSPINGARQRILNLNFANINVFNGVMEKVLKTRKAVMNKAVVSPPSGLENLRANLAISQFRHSIADYVHDPLTFLAYPVFDSFESDEEAKRNRDVVAILATNIHWKIFFQRILPASAMGIICVLENSYNETFSYRVDGGEATFLGLIDAHDPSYNHLMEHAGMNEFVQDNAGPETRSYTTTPLSQELGQYTLKVYPSNDTEEYYTSDMPALYATVVACAFFFTSAVFVIFAIFVERRQHAVMTTAIKNAVKAASIERELNEFLSHEVRNPISAAISACGFVTSALEDQIPAAKNNVVDLKESLKDDVKVIETSLHYVNDFLRSMLDMHRAAMGKVVFRMDPVDLKYDVLQAVSDMLYQRNFPFEIKVNCPENLVLETDCLRLKQIIVNLGVNASKFVQAGFIRFGAEIVGDFVELYVEDSGPGIALEKRGKLFEKYSNRLDQLNQGTGIGLCLSKNLAASLGAELQLDETYDSGIKCSPGSRFVVRFPKDRLKAVSPSEESTESLAGSGTSDQRMKDSTKGSATASMSESCSALSDVFEKQSVEVAQKTPEASQQSLPENLRVLFVDDDTVLRKLFYRCVKRVAPNWQVEQAASGEAALRLVESNTYSLIWMDQYMPSTTKTLLGTETVRAMRAKGVTSRICGLSANALVEPFLKAGADCFLLKPFPTKKDEMDIVLRRALGMEGNGGNIGTKSGDRKVSKKETEKAVGSAASKSASASGGANDAAKGGGALLSTALPAKDVGSGSLFSIATPVIDAHSPAINAATGSGALFSTAPSAGDVGAHVKNASEPAKDVANGGGALFRVHPPAKDAGGTSLFSISPHVNYADKPANGGGALFNIAASAKDVSAPPDANQDAENGVGSMFSIAQPAKDVFSQSLFSIASHVKDAEKPVTNAANSVGALFSLAPPTKDVGSQPLFSTAPHIKEANKPAKETKKTVGSVAPKSASSTGGALFSIAPPASDVDC